MKKVTQQMRKTSNLSVLYIERDVTLQTKISTHLKKIFSDVYQAFCGEEGLQKYQKIKTDIVITDLNLLDKSGFELIIEIQETNPNVSIIVLSYGNSDFQLLETIDLGIVALLKKPLNITTLNKALQKIIVQNAPTIEKIEPKKVNTEQENLIPKQPSIKKTIVHNSPKTEKVISKSVPQPIVKKPTIVKPKVIKPTIPKPIIRDDKDKNPTVVTPIKESIVKQEQKSIEKQINPQPKKLQSITPLNIITKSIQQKLETTAINSYKGLMITNKSHILGIVENSFKVKVNKTQLVAILYEKQSIINIEKHYINAKLIDIDRKNSIVTFTNPQIIKFQSRDTQNKRICTDKSFKASINFNNTHFDLTPIDVSFNYITLETTELFGKGINSSVDLTLGFEINGPSSLIVEKKFVKAFATGIIQRVDRVGNKKRLIIKHTLQKSGQNIYKKYLQEREIEIINEFKMKLKI